MKYFTLSLVMIAAAFSFNAAAQSKDAEKYKQQSLEIRKQVWAWDKPQFKVKNIPTQYATASKVILAHHTELTADSKSKFSFIGFGFGTQKEQNITEVVREMVKLNDKNAVTEFSELSFTQFKKSSGFNIFEKTTSYIGVRIIKPNGSIKEINADDIILTQDGSKEKKSKVAIPDLQPGDILDYFITTQQQLTNDFSTKAYSLLLFNEAPILSLSFHAQLGKKFAVEYRSYNGAPELAVSKNDDKDIIIDVEKTNIPASETSLWVAPGMQLPFVRMNIALGYRGMGSRLLESKKPGEVLKKISGDEYMDDKATALSVNYYNDYWMKAAKDQFDKIVIDARKKAKQNGTSFRDLSDLDKTTLLFYTMRYTKLLNFNIDELSKKISIGDNSYNGLAFVLFCTLKAANLDPAILISNNRTGYRMNEIMDADDLEATAYITGASNFLSMHSIYDIPFTAPSEIEGVSNNKSFTFDHPNMILGIKKMQGLTNIAPGFDVPVTSADKNTHIENLKLQLNPEKTNLSVHRSTTLKGFYKEAAQRELILYEDFYEEERLAFKDEKTLLEDLEDGRKSKKYADEVKSAFAEARKQQKIAFTKEAKDWFEQDITNLKDYKTDTLGVRHTAPNFVYSASFNLDGLVKKAGNNIIIEIGKIQGQPFIVKEEQRKRDLDVYMPYARSLEYNIELQIPEGYSAEGVKALNKTVTTEAGFFTATATATDKLVTIQIKKQYTHNFEPAKNWDKLMLFMDAASDWTSTKLLLKKK